MLNSVSRNAWLLATLLSVFLFSCVSFKPSASSGRGKLYETFYVGEYGTQYFIEPLAFDAENGSRILTDFTFRYKDRIKDSVVINFSIYSPTVYRKIDSVLFENGMQNAASKAVSLIFNEKSKKQVISRFTTKITLEDFTKLFTQKSWLFSVYTGGVKEVYYSKKRTKKSIEKINADLIVLMAP